MPQGIDDLAAGNAALRRGAWRDARRAFERALRRENSAEAHEGLGWSLYWLGDTEESLRARESAYRAFRERGDERAAARVAIGLAVGSYDLRGASVATGWLERAGQLLRREKTGTEPGWLALYRGHIARMSGENDAALRFARRAMKIGCDLHEEQLELLARALEGLALVNQGKVTEGMRRVDEATAAAMAGEMRDLDSIAQTCCMLLYACERVHDYKRAAEWHRRIDAFCREWKIETLFDVCTTQHAAMLAGCGQWSEAEAELERAIVKLEKTRPLLVDDALVHLSELRRKQGRIDEALALASRCETRTEATLTRAAIALDRGDAITASDLAERVLARNLGEKWVERAIALELIVRASLVRGDRAAAAEALARLTNVAARVDTPIASAYELRARGEFLLAGRELDAARDAFVKCFDLFVASRAPFEAAVTRLRLARVLHALGHDTAAAQEIDNAASTLEELGAKLELGHARALREELSKPAAREADAMPLSRREREVLQLIAGGLADKELAVRLSLSQHTVHRHVSNILRKLDVASRTAAVAAAARSGWL